VVWGAEWETAEVEKKSMQSQESLLTPDDYTQTRMTPAIYSLEF
jgi:hypothetical protein